jgi:GT2 family glycosyltransferase
VAFFAESHIDMTVRFLNKLHDEVDRIAIFHNGGTLAAEGQKMLDAWADIQVFDAEGWTFFKMWNRGAMWAQAIGADVALFLNNDIEWPPGALRELGESLARAPEDIAAASPDPASDFKLGELVDINATPAYRGLMGWCFAVRPSYWQSIDERYQVWYGDDELGLLLNQAGWRCVRAGGIPVQHPVNETTMQYRDGLWDMRREDEALYNSKWA